MNSQDYWRERELANIAADYISDEALLSKIRSIYNHQLYEITKEIDSFYQRYAGASGLSCAEAKKAVSQFDVKSFEGTAKRMVQERDFSDEANRQLKLYNATMRINRLELLKSKIGYYLTEMGDDANNDISGHAKAMIVETYRRQGGILGDSVNIDVWKKAEQIIKGSYHGATFSQRIWRDMNVLHAEVGNLLERYLINGKGSIELARELKKLFGTTAYEAERLARTEIRRMQTATQEDFMRENGITQYKYLAEPTACHICSPLDDEVFELTDMQVGTNASPMHPNCRCSIIKV